MSRPGFWRGPFWVGVVAGLVALAAAWQATRWARVTVDFDAASVGRMKMYLDTGEGFAEKEVITRIFPAAGDLERTFFVPALGVERLRFDPTDHAGAVLLRDLRWREPWPGGRGTVDLASLSWQGVASVQPAANGPGIRLQPTVPAGAAAPDPRAVLALPGTRPAAFWWSLRGGVALGVGGLAALGAALWNRRVAGAPTPPRREPSHA